MDNENREYDYYVPDDTPIQGGGCPEPEKKGKPAILKVIAGAVVFGVVASFTFGGTNYVRDTYLREDSNGTKVFEESKDREKKNDSTVLSHVSNTVTSDISGIVDESMPSVVSITNMSVQEVQDFFGGVRQRESESRGSGIIVGKNDKELLIVTNNHVVEGSNSLTVTFIDNKNVEAKLKGTDPSRDLAVVAVPLKDIDKKTSDAIKVAVLGDSTKLKVGEPVIAIGNALGYGQSVTTGIVSALNRGLGGEPEGKEKTKYIQTDAAINQGNSGGALLNANGEVIGINTAKLSGNTVEGMGYAIPISDVSEIIENLMNRKTRDIVDAKNQGALGVMVRNVDDGMRELYNIPKGVLVADVVKEGPAEKAGITKGDIITEVDGQVTTDASALVDNLKYYKAGENVKLKIAHLEKKGGYTEKMVTVKLQKKAEQ